MASLFGSATKALDWEEYRKWLFNNKSEIHAKYTFKSSKKNHHLAFTNDLVFMKQSRKKLDILKGIANLTRFLDIINDTEFHEEFTKWLKKKEIKWRMTLDRVLTSISPPLLQSRRISVQIKFWLSEQRLQKISGNDLDNLTKPVLDSMKRIGMIRDDDQIFHLEATKFPTTGFEEIELVISDWN